MFSLGAKFFTVLLLAFPLNKSEVLSVVIVLSPFLTSREVIEKKRKRPQLSEFEDPYYRASINEK